MFYRVQCVDRATGAEVERLYHAGSPEQAAKMAMQDGFVVGGVRPDTGAPPAAPVLAEPVVVDSPGRLSAYSRRRGPRARDELRAFFEFEAFILPVLVKAVFIMSTAVAVLVTLGAPIVWLVVDEKQSGAGAMLALVVVGYTWGCWLIQRLFAEVCVVFFSMHERLREISENTAPRGS